MELQPPLCKLGLKGFQRSMTKPVSKTHSSAVINGTNMPLSIKSTTGKKEFFRVHASRLYKTQSIATINIEEDIRQSKLNKKRASSSMNIRHCTINKAELIKSARQNLMRKQTNNVYDKAKKLLQNQKV